MKTNHTVKVILTAAVIVIALAVLLSVSATAATIMYSGECGDDMTWTFDSDGVLNITGTGEMYDYSKGGERWANNYKNIKKIIISEGVTTIGPHAFKDSGVESVSLPSTLVGIGYNSFTNCDNLTAISLPTDLDYVGEEAFKDCELLKTVKFPSGMNCEIYPYAFKSCKSLDSLSMDNVTIVLGIEDFSGCAAMRSVKITNSTLTFGTGGKYPRSVFYGCTSLETVYITGSMTVDGYGCRGLFADCSSLKSVTIDAGLNEIPDNAFAGCSSLKDLSITDGYTAIGDYAFKGCSALEGFNVPIYVTSIGEHAFENCADLKTVEFINSDNKISISVYNFYNCPSLTKAVVTRNVRSIGSKSFYNCPLLTVYVEPLSPAETYAKENGIFYLPIGATPTPAPTAVPTATPKPTATPRPVSISDVWLEADEDVLYLRKSGAVREAVQLNIYPSNAAVASVTWTSSNNKSVKVDSNGNIQAYAKGTAVIKAAVKDTFGKTLTAEIKVTVKKNTKKIKKISFDEKTVWLSAGDKYTPGYTFKPATSFYDKLTWTSSNKKVAKVSSKGVITARKRGKAIITVKTSNGKKAKLTIRVY